MNLLDEATKYFKSGAGYARMFTGIKNKYISLGELRGNVIINKPTEAEKQALSGLMKKDYSKKSSITINIRKLQEILAKSRFEGVELLDLLENYFGEEILTKKENKRNYQNEFDSFLENIMLNNKDEYIYKYLEKSIQNKDKLYMDIKRSYNKNKETIRDELLWACKGINYLRGGNRESNKENLLRIPVFASKITSNPHAFDKKQLCGKLFILLLCYVKRKKLPRDSEELAELYYESGLLVDDVSSMVLCKNILGMVKDREEKNKVGKSVYYVQHEGLKGFCNYNEPIFLTLYNLSNLRMVGYNEYKKVVITENPAVFMGIMEKCLVKDFPLICTYGQVKLAGIMLLDLLAKQDYKLYYSGDLDPEGIQIADRLKQRYKGKIELLGFDTDTYYRNISNMELMDDRLKKLNSVKSSELADLCNEIARNKRVAYEEENIEWIVEFIEEKLT